MYANSFKTKNIPFFNNTALKRYFITTLEKIYISLTLRSCSLKSKCKEVLTPD